MNFNFATHKNTAIPQHAAQKAAVPPKTRLTKKYTLNGFTVTDIVWVRPSEGRHKLEVLVRYIDPECARTKRPDGSYQKVIKFGQKGVVDYTDLPHMNSTRDKVLSRLKVNCDNPLHPNFYVKHVLNGQSTDPFENFKLLKRHILSP